MDIQASKIALVKMILNIDNQKMIERIFNVIKSEEEDFWMELTDSEKEEIKLGIEQLEAGERISMNDFLKQVSK